MPTNNELERICNIAGYPIYPWAVDQLRTRSEMGSQTTRDDSNILYLANKGAWVRVVSSVNLEGDLMNYYRTNINANIARPQDLAESYVLYGGTSTYAFESSRTAGTREEMGDLIQPENTGMNLRSGIGNNGSYNLLGDIEVQNYGYKPMPGITSVTIESTGRLGSLRQATINFKVWDKYQLDIMDALYFRPGFTVLIEYGHAKYYTNGNYIGTSPTTPPQLESSEQYMINPFTANLTKEEIGIQIATRIQKSFGNYGGMLGLVTQFNFTMTQDGGYDCTIKAMALGSVLGNFPINHASALPDVYYLELKKYLNTQQQLDLEKAKKAADALKTQQEQKALENLTSSNDYWSQFVLNNYNLLQPYDISSLNLLYNTDNLVYTEFDLSRNLHESIIGNSAEVSAVTSSAVSYISNHNLNGYVSSTNGDIKAYYAKKDITYTVAKIKTEIPKYNYGAIYFDSPNNLKGKYIAGYGLDDPKQNGYIKVKLDINSMNLAINSQNTIVMTGLDINYKPSGQDYFNALIVNGISNSGTYTKGYVYNYRQTNTIKLGQYSIYIKYDKSNIEESHNYFTNYNTEWTVLSVSSNVDNNQDVNGSNNVNDMYVEVILGLNPDPTKYHEEKWPYTIKIGNYKNSIDNIELGYNTLADLSFIREIITTSDNQNLLTTKTYQDYQTAKSKAQDDYVTAIDTKKKQIETQYKAEQLANTVKSESTLELMLRSIILRELNGTVKKLTNEELDDFYKKIFQEGAYAALFSEGVPEERYYSTDDYKAYVNGGLSPGERLEFNARYGNNFYLMSGENAYDSKSGKELKNIVSGDGTKIPQVNFNKLLSTVRTSLGVAADLEVPVKQYQSVYITLGSFMLMLNHTGILYGADTKDKLSKGDVITPIAYIDFNPETNYYLSSKNQISIDPFKFLVPYAGGDSYKDLFDTNLLDSTGKNISYTSSESTTPTTEPLFDFATKDIMSNHLQNNKEGLYGIEGGYVGKLMNVMVNVDYLLTTIQHLRGKSDTNEVYFQAVIETILNDLNKCMGNYNAFRLSYNDNSNCFVITDDQIQSSPDKAVAATHSEMINDPANYEIPILGKKSIARSFEIRTDISTRLASMLAISSNPGASNQVATAKNTTDFGVYNTGSFDRYIPMKVDGTSSTPLGSKDNTQAAELAINFNTVISSIYGHTYEPMPKGTEDFTNTPYVSANSLQRALTYYIDRMAHIKNSQPGSVHAMIIPLKTNITMDGMAGLYPFQLFTIDENVLPYRYSQANLTIGPTDRRKVAFSIARMTHTISNNEWTTSVEGFMTLLRNSNDQKANISTGPKETDIPIPMTGPVSGMSRKEVIQRIVARMRSFGWNDAVIAGFLGNMQVETGFNTKYIFSNSKDPGNSALTWGLVQWQGSRRLKLMASGKYNTIEGQVDFIKQELETTEKVAGASLKGIPDTPEGAITAGTNVRNKYERPSSAPEYATSYNNRVKFASLYYIDLKNKVY